MLKEFQKFAVKGNMIDMAVGIIIGAAFGTVVKSLVDDIIMPPIGMLLGGVDFTDLFIPLAGGDYASLIEAQEAGAPTLNYGLFINNVIAFLIVAFAVFILVKAVNKLKDAVEKEEEVAPAAVEPPKEQVLLEEIRDLLKKQNG
ncbi:large conductance mechanosensitive channel protein MscL [Parvularcula flava]|uniref:Large-conductance mechanosensitive channel n=1 Tax=Aquisalinus luteolus TaxID=1566827 RepID=A0A8J3A4P7_9PROT|nr:large conductance mechanosensitive channel protein MscL [Aquisalinus luteolus]NHK28409.1 large conductance mechanosensitive channel protein MscL [Aquisalinus luteolus]GGH98387.1 hypothetical protein GCM10011355_21860 [Aquisalinus luteolus]